MMHTHKLIKAKISMRARKEKKNKSQVVLQYLNKKFVLSNDLIKVELPP